MKYLYSIFLSLITATSVAEIKLPAIFSDNMVLQRDAEVQVWGWAEPGEEVKIHASWSEKILSVQANKDGNWELFINTPNLRGPQTLTITGDNEIIIENILLGEVWLASGQSNMEWTAASGIENSEEAIAGAEQPEIRLFQVVKNTSTEPQQDLEGYWVQCTPETMKNFSAIAYFFGKNLLEELRVPVGLINSSWGGTPAEVWMPAETFKKNKELQKAVALLPEQHWNPPIPGKMYNAMIAPLVPFKLAGILWYQGESNTATANYYKLVFSKLIESWRGKWKEELPFFYAQIAPFDYGKGYGGVEVRDAQRRVLELPNTGMVVTSDIGNIHDIHPQNKLDVGKRFANLALSKVYGKDIIANGPLFKKAQLHGSTVKIFFTDSEGLRTDKNNFTSQFEIAGKEKVFFSAKAEIKKEVVHLKSPKVKEPLYVRFSWGNTSISNIFNIVDLPASSFTAKVQEPKLN